MKSLAQRMSPLGLDEVDLETRNHGQELARTHSKSEPVKL